MRVNNYLILALKEHNIDEVSRADGNQAFLHSLFSNAGAATKCHRDSIRPLLAVQEVIEYADQRMRELQTEGGLRRQRSRKAKRAQCACCRTQ